jgi:cytochrome c5
MNIQKKPCVKALMIAATLAVSGCGPQVRPDQVRPEVGVKESTVKAATQPPISLDQGWTADVQQRFWFTDQGTQILLYPWFLALEQADSDALFRTDNNMERLGYLPERPSSYNPDGLPIGFVATRDPTTKQQWFGLTCAACHTGQIKYQGHIARVDGGPTLADFNGFLDEVLAALQATVKDDVKFQRFAQRVLDGKTGDTEVNRLRTGVNSQIAFLSDRIRLNHPPYPAGHGRVDAFGNIFNEVFVRDLNIPENKVPPSAPVSYPFLWDTPQHDVVQWNGAAPNAGIGPLLRNIGEVLGVFGNVTVDHRPSLVRGLKSTINVRNLSKLEGWLHDLWSPQWPEQILPQIDSAQAARGKAHYDRYCVSCHAPIKRNDPRRRVNAVMTRVAVLGTDPTMAQNAAQRITKTGILEGTREMIIVGNHLGPVEPGTKVGPVVAAGVALGHPLQALQAIKAGMRRYHRARKAQPFDPLSYKARSLNGIWATAPYLHNGSVPNLWQLLQPVSGRDNVFYVGSYEFDPKHVGFLSTAETNGFRFDAQLPGNSNAGHEYGTHELTDEQKWELIEYLKTL